MDQLLGNQDLVRLILSYHLIPGVAATASSLTNGQSLPTGDEGQNLTVIKSGSRVQFKPSASGAPTATVTTADITAGQAIVHIIDQVLIPANAQLPSTTTGGAARANATATGTATGATTAGTTGGTTTRAAGTTGTAGTAGAGASTGTTGTGTTAGAGGSGAGGSGAIGYAGAGAGGGVAPGGRKLLHV